ncbi:MAG TPA: hypothetical protein VHZ24_22455 [Pirellulales bacterium]|jgi:hypothetical protein|nr:hypothetical protein [Pirellulales bacterium]
MEPTTDNAPPRAMRRPNFIEQFWPKIKPYIDRVWLVIRVWVPVVATPIFRQSQVVYTAREHREGGVWNVALPRLCLECGREEVSGAQQFRRKVRNFESPVGVLAAIFGVFVFFLMLTAWLESMITFCLALASLVLGGAFLFVKSWEERVQLTAWACGEHASGLVCPGLVPREEELYVVVPSPKVIEAAKAQIEADRRSKQPYARSEQAPQPTMPIARPVIRPGDIPPVVPPSPELKSYRREELPPIKLDE